MSEPFQIVTIPLGGRIGICPLPGRGGDLDRDLAAIAAWQAALVVSMTEMTELAAFESTDLPARLAQAGVAWRHFPIIDFGTPAPEALPAWSLLSAELHGALDRGEGVLLHCRGGLGRSGMIALRLMVERGEQPETALARLRQFRPGAVETEEQRVWGSGGKLAARTTS
jgi:protein-tyrosine phosphatase